MKVEHSVISKCIHLLGHANLISCSADLTYPVFAKSKNKIKVKVQSNVDSHNIAIVISVWFTLRLAKGPEVHLLLVPKSEDSELFRAENINREWLFIFFPTYLIPQVFHWTRN